MSVIRSLVDINFNYNAHAHLHILTLVSYFVCQLFGLKQTVNPYSSNGSHGLGNTFVSRAAAASDGLSIVDEGGRGREGKRERERGGVVRSEMISLIWVIDKKKTQLPDYSMDDDLQTSI